MTHVDESINGTATLHDGVVIDTPVKIAAEVMKFLMFGDVGVVIVLLEWKVPGDEIIWYDEVALYI